MKNSIKLVLVLLIIISKPASCQRWVENIISQHFENEPVNDLGVTDSCLWINTGVLIKYDGINFTSYCVSSNSEGPLKEYIGTQPGGSIFDMKIENNIILLADRYNHKILKIQNDYIYNYDISKLNTVLTEISIDNNGNIWLIFLSEYIKGGMYSNIYQLKNGSIIKFNIKNYKKPSVSLFFTNEKNKYIICYRKTVRDSIENKLLIINEMDSVKEYSLDTYKYNFGFRYYISNDSIYILSGKGVLYRVINDSMVTLTTFPEIQSSRCYDFIVADNNVYYSVSNDSNSFHKYNFSTQINSVTTLYYYFPIYLTKMRLYNDYIIGQYSNCNVNFTGLKIFRYD